MCWRLKLGKNDTKRKGITISKTWNCDTSPRLEITSVASRYSLRVSRYPPSKKHPKFKTVRGIAISYSLVSRDQHRERTKFDKNGSLCPPEALIIEGSFKGILGIRIGSE
ncbi:hypothetical protein J1N35_041439, partial [Gossypium stocksii]